MNKIYFNEGKVFPYIDSILIKFYGKDNATIFYSKSNSRNYPIKFELNKKDIKIKYVEFSIKSKNEVIVKYE